MIVKNRTHVYLRMNWGPIWMFFSGLNHILYILLTEHYSSMIPLYSFLIQIDIKIRNTPHNSFWLYICILNLGDLNLGLFWNYCIYHLASKLQSDGQKNFVVPSTHVIKGFTSLTKETGELGCWLALLICPKLPKHNKANEDQPSQVQKLN